MEIIPIPNDPPVPAASFLTGIHEPHESKSGSSIRCLTELSQVHDLP